MLMTGGYFLGRNWERIGFYLTTYSQVVTTIVVIVVVVIVVRYLMRRNERRPGRVRRGSIPTGARKGAAGSGGGEGET